jgi:hypothetical protein
VTQFGVLGRMIRYSSVITAVVLLAALQSPTQTWAWGRLGHRVISRIAEKQLTPAAKAALRPGVRPPGEPA